MTIFEHEPRIKPPPPPLSPAGTSPFLLNNNKTRGQHQAPGVFAGLKRAYTCGCSYYFITSDGHHPTRIQPATFDTQVRISWKWIQPDLSQTIGKCNKLKSSSVSYDNFAAARCTDTRRPPPFPELCAHVEWPFT